MAEDEMRPGFRAISEGWMLIDDVGELGDRIERIGVWQKEHGPLNDIEKATIELMIESQIARGIQRGDFKPYLPGRPTGATLLFRLRRLARVFEIMNGRPPTALFVPGCLSVALEALAEDDLGLNRRDLAGGFIFDSVAGLKVRLCSGTRLGVGIIREADDTTPPHNALWHDG